MNDVIFKGIWVLLGIIMLRYYAKRKHTVKSAFFGMLSGGTVLVIMPLFWKSYRIFSAAESF